MSGQEFLTNNEKLEFRQIVLEHLRKILNLSLRIYNQGMMVDCVKTYRNSILSLSDVLLPFYDKEMDDAYKKYQEDFEKVSKANCREGLVGSKISYVLGIKITSRQLFRQLNLLLKRVDYLKSAIYGENDSDLD